MIITGITVDQFKRAVMLASRRYGDNLVAEIGTKYSQTRFNARVIPVTTGYRLYGRGTELAPGQRRSWQGRRCNAVCWHAYRDVLYQLFGINPDARVKTMYADYRGAEGFLREYPGTAHLNVGTLFQPAYPIDLCDCVSQDTSLQYAQAQQSDCVARNAVIMAALDRGPDMYIHHTAAEQEMIDWWAQQSKRALARS